MRKFFPLFLSMIFLVVTAGAQGPAGSGKIGGTVVDGDRKTVQAATVALVRRSDSSAIKFTAASADGRYLFEGVPAGHYRVKVSAAGHATAYSEVVSVGGDTALIRLKTIHLAPEAKALAGVTVTAARPFIEQKIDRTVVNVDASPSNAGATALEVLEKSPGITVDRDGNISLKGKQGVLVMIDGRPTYLSAAELANYLKSLPASALEQVEIMTNPSSRYDAAGNSGIINIRTKKNKQKGMNGSVTVNYGQGRFWKSNNSANLNYRTGKFNLFANGSANQWNGFQRLEIHRSFKKPSGEPSAIFDQVSHMRNSSRNYNLKLGADYFLDKKTTLGLVANGFAMTGDFSSLSSSTLMNGAKQVDSIVEAQSRNHNDWKNGSLNLNLRHQFDTAGRELSADLDYIGYRTGLAQTFANSSFDPSRVKKGGQELRGDLPVNINIYTAKTDYVHPLGKEAKLEAGLKTSFVKTANAADYFQRNGQAETPDYTKTNHFDYTENINAAYVNLRRQYKKIGLQGGLRYEQTDYTGRQSGNPTAPDSSFRRSYGNLFPTVYISYNAAKHHQFATSYGRRIDRPAYQDLNPFLFFLDNYTYQQGNPFLKPMYSHNVELAHTFKSFLTTTLNFNTAKDMVTETFEQGKSSMSNGQYTTIIKRGNIGRRTGGGLSISAQVPVRKWWTAIVYTNANYNAFTGRINGGELIDVQAANLMANINNQFKWGKGWAAELSGFYRSRGVEGQIRIEPLGQLSTGLSKTVLKGAGTVKLNVRDLLYTQYPHGSISFQQTDARFSNRHDSRVATVSFSYRFGKPIKGLPQRKASGGAGDEQSRVRVGN
ncbi:TonB-dependent receptor [Paraflavisolibacter sp. H34]|uniref:TonB-dependent receptor domain-containing protein n=1 Tax=Huijunlia imazamoxiresistens TaxID=3127457 RepID=UPI003017D376